MNTSADLVICATKNALLEVTGQKSGLLYGLETDKLLSLLL